MSGQYSSELALLSSHVQLWSLPLEILGLLLVVIELFFKKRIKQLEDYLDILLLAVRIYFNYFSKANAEEEGLDPPAWHRANYYAKALEKFTFTVMKSLVVVFFFNIIYFSYRLSASYMEGSVWNNAVWLATTLGIFLILFVVFGVTMIHARSGKGAVFAIPFITMFTIAIILKGSINIVLYPIYYTLFGLDWLGKGNVLGAIGVLLAFTGVLGEFFQVWAQCIDKGPFYFDLCATT